jgi:outer membrane protein
LEGSLTPCRRWWSLAITLVGLLAGAALPAAASAQGDSVASAATATAPTTTTAPSATAPSAATLSDSAPIPAISLQQAVERALAVSPTMAAAAADLQTAQATHRSATGAFLPSVTASSGIVRSNQTTLSPSASPSVTGPAQTSYATQVQASLELFDGGRRTAAVRSARAQTTAADAGLLQGRYATILTAKQTFYEALRADQLIAVAEARIRQAERSRGIARGRRAAGTTTRSDELRAELELTAAREALLSAREQRQAATLALGRLVGANGPVAATADTATLVPTPVALPRAELEALAADQAPAVVSARARNQAAVAIEREAKSAYLPSVKAGAAYTAANDVILPGAARDGWQLQLGLTYPLFDGFQREQRVTAAGARVNASEAEAADATRLARAEAGRLAGAVSIAEERIKLATTAVDAAQEDLRVIEARYRVGASAILDLITSQLNLVQAETNLVTARFDYLVARAGLEALVGRDL